MDINILPGFLHTACLPGTNSIIQSAHLSMTGTLNPPRCESCFGEEQPDLQSCLGLKTIKELYSRKGTKVLLVETSQGGELRVVKITELPQTNGSVSTHLKCQAYFSSLLYSGKVQHLAKIDSIFFTSRKCLRVMQYACCGDITQFINNPVSNYDSVEEKNDRLALVKNILWQVIAAIQEIHALGFVIRDLKPENILLSKGRVLLCDFGLVGLIGEVDSSLCGTPEYMPPERISNKREFTPINQSIDYWALGIIAYELIMGYTPYMYANGDLDGLLQSMYGGYISFDEELPNSCKRFVFSLLQTNPQKRLKPDAMRSHEFFRDFKEVPLDIASCKCLKKRPV